MINSIFLDIIKGNTPAYKIAEDENHLAFLDKEPLKNGHTLVIPKKQVDKLYNLKKEEFTKIMNFTYIVIKSIEKTIFCKRVALFVLGFEIPHAHIHLIPINKESDIDFSKPRIKNVKNSLSEISNKIKNNYIKIFKKLK